MRKSTAKKFVPVIAFFFLIGSGLLGATIMSNQQIGALDLRNQASGGNLPTCRDGFKAEFGNNFNLAGENWDRSNGNDLENGKLRQVLGPGRNDAVWFARRRDMTGDFLASVVVESMNFTPTGNQSGTASLKFGQNLSNHFGVTLSKRGDGKIYLKSGSEDNKVSAPGSIQELQFTLPVTLTLVRTGTNAQMSVTKNGNTISLGTIEGVHGGRGRLSLVTEKWNADGLPVRAQFDDFTVRCP